VRESFVVADCVESGFDGFLLVIVCGAYRDMYRFRLLEIVLFIPLKRKLVFSYRLVDRDYRLD
jgi:hypothetical protein